MENNIIDKQAGLKTVILNELKRRMIVHRDMLSDIQLALLIGLSNKTACELAKEIKNIQDKLEEKIDQVCLYVLPETVDEVAFLVKESNTVCDSVRKSIRESLIGS